MENEKIQPTEREYFEAMNRSLTDMWANRHSKYQFTSSPFAVHDAIAEGTAVAEEPKPGHLLIQLREGEEYAY